jgi:hypothetical protein
MTHARRVDGNQKEIVKALHSPEHNYNVIPVFRVGCGFPDLLVVSKSNIPVLLELKMPGEKLTTDEKLFHANYTAPLCIVRSAEEALDVMQDYDQRMIEII